METQVLLAKVPAVLERTLSAAGPPDHGGGFRGRSTVFPLGDILRFVVSDEDAGRAARLASEYAREFVRFRRELDPVGLGRTMAQV